MQIYTAKYDSPVGMLTLAADGSALAGLWIEGQKYFLGKLGGLQVQPCVRGDLSVLDEACFWLDRYFAGQKPSPRELRLAPAGSDFAQSVWRILCEIPYGTTVTYGEIARRISDERRLSSMSAQAVGGAVGHNPISIIIPCHRVVGSDGSLTGYAGGLEKKSWLLRHEGAVLKNGLCLSSNKSVAKNIGLDNSGVHCGVNPTYEIHDSIDHKVTDWPKAIAVDEREYEKQVEFFRKKNKPQKSLYVKLK